MKRLDTRAVTVYKQDGELEGSLGSGSTTGAKAGGGMRGPEEGRESRGRNDLVRG